MRVYQVSVVLDRLIGWESFDYSDNLVMEIEASDARVARGWAVGIFDCELARRASELISRKTGNADGVKVGIFVDYLRYPEKVKPLESMHLALLRLDDYRHRLRLIVRNHARYAEDPHHAYMAERVAIWQRGIPMLDRWYAALLADYQKRLEADDMVFNLYVPVVESAERLARARAYFASRAAMHEQVS